MSLSQDNLYAGLKRTFHEPSRLAIVSALCKTGDGLTFNELKDECELTFGNLSSHLKTLQEAGVIHIQKSFVDNKPCTTISLTEPGREQFVDYLKALEGVLTRAAEAVSPAGKKGAAPFFSVRPAQA